MFDSFKSPSDIKHTLHYDSSIYRKKGYAPVISIQQSYPLFVL